MNSSKGAMCFAALALLAFVCHAAIDATSQAISVDASGDDTASIPDFDGDGTIGFGDFVKFAAKFGLRHGDDGYDALYDLNGDAEIGFSDFVLFAQNFGKEAPSPVVAIPDANLRAAIGRALGKAGGAPITVREMATLDTLEASDADISDLTGLEYATNLTFLDLASNDVTNVSVLEGLTNLTHLVLSGNDIVDLASLAANTDLGTGDTVELSDNPLNVTSRNTHIPALQARGVSVYFYDTRAIDEPQIYNDDIFVFPVSEDLTSDDLPLDAYARNFYEQFEDEFDFLIFVRNVVAGADSVHGDAETGYFFSRVKNDIQGIGLRIFSSAPRFGSSGKLQGIVFLVWVEFDESWWGPWNEIRLFKDGPIRHELMHRWANFIVPSFRPHWGFSSANGVLGGFDIANLVELGGGQFTAGNWGTAGPNEPPHFSPIELYLAGFIPSEEVPDLWVAEDGDWVRNEQGRRVWNYDKNGWIFTASQVKIYTIEDIIAEHGSRVPDHTQSQKDFRAAVILLTDEKHPANPQVLKGLSEDVSWFSYPGDSEVELRRGIERYNFWKATGGRGTITMDGLSQSRRRSGAKIAVPRNLGTPSPPIVDHWDAVTDHENGAVNTQVETERP